VAEQLGLADFATATKLSGSGFALFTGAGALLERALINWMLDVHVTEHGYTEVSPPFIVNRDCMTGTGQLPKMEEDMYRCDTDDLFLIHDFNRPKRGNSGVMIIPRDRVRVMPLQGRNFTYQEMGASGDNVKGLVAGSGLAFEDFGTYALKGVPDEELVKLDPERAQKFITGRDALTARDRKEWSDTQGILRDVTLGLEAVLPAPPTFSLPVI